MRELIRKLDEYGFSLTEEEIELIAKQAEEMSQLYQRLYDVKIDQEAPASKEPGK
jgi:hypothetical protein